MVEARKRSLTGLSHDYSSIYMTKIKQKHQGFSASARVENR